MVELIIRIY